MTRKSVRCNNCFETIESVQCNCGCWTDLRSQQNQSDETAKKPEIVMNVYELVMFQVNEMLKEQAEKIEIERLRNLETIKNETLIRIQSPEFTSWLIDLLIKNRNICTFELSWKNILALKKCESDEQVEAIVQAFRECGFPNVGWKYEDQEESYFIILSSLISVL